MADISVLVAKITFVVVEINFKEDVITSSVANITYIVVEITFKVVQFFSAHDNFCSE